MHSNSASPAQAQLTVDTQELLAFHQPKTFNLFLYSRSSANVPVFLLHKLIEAASFSHFSGEFTKHDPVIFFAVAREFLRKTAGLLHKDNLKYFLAENANPFADNELLLEENPKVILTPKLGFSATSDDICRLLCESPYVFQESNGNMAFFIELPMLSLEAIKEVAMKKELNFEMGYFSLEELLNTENQEISGELKKSLENKKLLTYIEKYIVANEPVEITGHYAMISCDSKNTGSLVPSLHHSIYKKHGEKWSYYRAYEGEFPTDEELKKFKGVIIPGSGHSAYDTTVTWYKELFECVRKIIYENQHINLLGICFGAQVIAQALGGRVEKMPRPFIRCGEILTTKPTFYELDYIKNLGFDSKKPLVIGQSHGDQIVELPAGAILHSSSANTNVELYTIDNNVLALQGHPEFNEPWTASSNYRVKKLNELDYDRYAEEYIKQTFPSPCTQDVILKFCYLFLKK